MSQATTTYITLNDPIFTSDTLAGINDAGQVVGYSTDGYGGSYTSFSVASYGNSPTFDPIVVPGAKDTFVAGIDNFGTVVGSILLSSGELGFIIGADGTITRVADPYAQADVFQQFNASDDVGYVVGVNGTPGSGVHGFVYDSISRTYMPVDAGPNTSVTGIDDYGDIVGTTADGSSFVEIAGNPTPITLGDPNHVIKVLANGINDEGQVVGTLIENSQATGFIFNLITDQYTFISDPNGTDTMLNGINDLGQAVGSFVDSAGNMEGLIVSTTGIVSVDYPIPGTTLSVPVGSGGIAVGRTADVAVIDRTGGSAPVVLIGNAGSDTLVGSSGDSNGASVADTIVSGSGSNVVFAYAGDTFLGGGTNLVVAGGTTPTIVASTGDDTVFSSAGAGMVFGGSAGQLLFVGGIASTTLVAGAGNLTALAGSAPDVVYGGTGATDLIGSSGGQDTFIGGAGSSLVYTGAGGGSIQGGTGNGVFVTANYGAAGTGAAGASTITAGQGASQIYVGNGDQVRLQGSANNTVGASSGNATLTGDTSTGNNVFLLGSGLDEASGGEGSDTFFLGTGAASITGGAGTDYYVATAGYGGNDTISGFRLGTDHLYLTGYGSSEIENALAVQQPVGGSSTTLTLSDHTHITLIGLTNVGGNIFG